MVLLRNLIEALVRKIKTMKINFDFKLLLSMDFWRGIIGLGEAPLLPADSRQVRPLTIVVAIMCGLGCIAALNARAGFRAADNWTTDLKSAMTILIETPKDEQSLIRAVTIIKSVDGVNDANIMTKEKAKVLLGNYGANIGSLIDEIPMPALIEVGLVSKNDKIVPQIKQKLSDEGFKIEIDDHSRYSGEILKTSTVLRAFALLALLALIIASVASIAFAARAALQSRSEAVEILHLVGAEDDFVAKEVQLRFMRLGLIAGAIGAAAAGIISLFGVIIMRIGASELTAGSELLKWYDIWILLIAPFVTALASAIAAKFAARETLRELV